jgi:hypothetical protein
MVLVTRLRRVRVPARQDNDATRAAFLGREPLPIFSPLVTTAFIPEAALARSGYE